MENRIDDPSPLNRKHLPHLSAIHYFNRPIILFVTICTSNRQPILANERAHLLIKKTWQDAAAWSVGRYVVMPDHLHFFCSPHDSEMEFRRWMQYWRNWVTRSWPEESEKPIWQKDYFDRQLRHGEKYHQKWEYVYNNPVRAGLVEKPEDWPFQGEMNPFSW
jgi:putative transposase